MCLLIAKPAGVDLPDPVVYDMAEAANPDGIGIGVCRAGETISTVHKGIASAEELHSVLSALSVCTQDVALIHFRYATHGTISAGATHPFPVSPRARDMTLLRYTAQTIVAHNGIIPIACSPGMSDTQTFVHRVLAYFPDFSNFDDLIGPLIQGSRLAMIDSGVLRIAGKGWVSDGGLLYSNLSFLYRAGASVGYGFKEMW